MDESPSWTRCVSTRAPTLPFPASQRARCTRVCTVADDGVFEIAQVYIRGASIRFYVVPDMLAQAPMFKRAGAAGMKGRGIGTARGRATIMRAQSRRGRGGGRPAIRR